MCGSTRGNFWLRTVTPELTTEFAGHHNARVWGCLCKILGVPSGSAEAQVASLALSAGGLGFTSAKCSMMPRQPVGTSSLVTDDVSCMQPEATDRRSSAKHPPRTPRTHKAPSFRQIGSPTHPFSWATSPMFASVTCASFPRGPPNTTSIVRCMPWPRAYSTEQLGGMVLRKWWHLGLAHCRKTCHAHCKSGIQGIASRPRDAAPTVCLDELERPDWLTPCGLHRPCWEDTFHSGSNIVSSPCAIICCRI